MTKSAKLEYQLNDFVKALNAELKFLLDCDSREGFSIENNNYHLLSEKEKYIVGVQTGFNRITDCIDQIEYIPVFIRRFPPREYFHKHGINQLKYIQYHLETFSHKVATLLDLMKLIVNEVFQAGIPEKDCSWDKLRKTVGVNERPMKLIAKYFEIFEYLIKFRHNVTHKGMFHDSEMNKINRDYGLFMYDYIETFGLEPDPVMLKRSPRWLIDYKIKNYRKEQLKKIDITLNNIYVLIKWFLESLVLKFQQKLKEIN